MNIYQTIWEADENRFSVSRKGDNGEFENLSADILLDEQIQADGRPNTDLAQFPLFHTVNTDKLNSEINALFIKLLNNYVVNYRDTEEYSSEELEEIYQFLEMVQTSKVWSVAFDYIENNLDEPIRDNFKDRMFNIWFKIYTNWYDENRTDYCSGFEHVFVGEGKYDEKPIIDGYHNWIKFLLDEKTGRVNFLGYNYGLNNNQGPGNLTVVTLQMIWELRDLNGDLIAELFKRKGGFFVGNSPECDLAMGTVAYFESKKGMFNDKDKQEVEIANSRLNLILYRNINRDGTRGEYLRSFFPEYLGDAQFIENLLVNTRSVNFDRSKLVRLNHQIYADFVYAENEEFLKEIILATKKDWHLSTKNWK